MKINMFDLNKNIGKRVKLVRHLFNDGRKLSADQFGHLLGESRDNITNYESGRAGLPVRVLYELYLRGINPVFIITGEGDVFADNPAGREFKQRLNRRQVEISDVSGLKEVEFEESKTLGVITVAAGRIEK